MNTDFDEKRNEITLIHFIGVHQWLENEFSKVICKFATAPLIKLAYGRSGFSLIPEHAELFYDGKRELL
ncbi:MAG: hypothetical protein OHK0041_01150 [Anaerolineales bacterium]